MSVHLKKPLLDALIPIAGVELKIGKAGIKQSGRDDLTLMTLSPKSQIAGVFTRNQFFAAPVYIAKEHLKEGGEIRALVINSGNANAGTGEEGREDARQTCAAVANLIDTEKEQVLPFSTGIIMEKLPVGKIVEALPHLRTANWLTAAEAIMTTDTVPKAYSASCVLNQTKIAVTGIAKGSGMIQPNMATMLAFVATDAKVAQGVLNQLIEEVVADSFNAITVDGDTSTNDSFVLIATGQAENTPVTLASPAYENLKKAVGEVVHYLALAIVRDGEGATKLITIKVSSAASKEEARRVAYSIARSPLVKTAFFASDANLGRIICAIGNAGIDDFAADKMQLYLGELLVAADGGVAPDYTEAASAEIMAGEEITLHIVLNRGEAATTVYTCDLSPEYIRINADYRT